jgi:hypothetical protein
MLLTKAVFRLGRPEFPVVCKRGDFFSSSDMLCIDGTCGAASSCDKVNAKE